MKNEEKARDILDRHYGYKVMAGTDLWFTKQYQDRFAHLLEMAEWKDSKIRDILFSYTKWLNKRGFFREDLQCDFEHQIDTFLEMSKEE